MHATPRPESPDTELAEILRGSLKSQFHAVLATLRGAIVLCPDDQWAAAGNGAPFWRVAYHALYYTHLYLQRDDTRFRPWESHQTGLQHLDDVPGPREIEELLEFADRRPQTGVPLSKEQLLTYWCFCDELVDGAVEGLDLLAPSTGFRWHTPPRPKVEHQIASIRHIQHHASQLAARASAATGERVEWVGSSRSDPHDAEPRP